MAEVNSKQAANVAAGIKNRAGDHNRVRALVITTPDTWSASNGDTMASKQVLPPGARVIGVQVGCAAGAASSTLSIGIRDAKDGANPDPDALCAAQAINAAGTFAVVSGATLTNGQDGLIPQVEQEVYFTFGGANPTANQDIRAVIQYIAP